MKIKGSSAHKKAAGIISLESTYDYFYLSFVLVEEHIGLAALFGFNFVHRCNTPVGINNLMFAMKTFIISSGQLNS